MHSTAEDCVYVAVNPKSIPIIPIAFEQSCEQRDAAEKANQANNHADSPSADAGKVGTTCESKDSDRVTNARQIREMTESLLYYSLYNCNNFLSRAFAVKTDVGFSQGVISTILSATTTVITPISSISSLIPTAINGGNTAISGGATDFNSAFYSGKSFDVMEAGIVAERQILRKQIEARLCMTEVNSTGLCSIPKSDNYAGYTPSAYNSSIEALIDVGVYDRVCSFEGGLKELAQQAAQKQQSADEANGVGTPTPSPSASPSKTASPDAASTDGATPKPHKPAPAKKLPAAAKTGSEAPASVETLTPVNLHETPARDDRPARVEKIIQAGAVSTVAPAIAPAVAIERPNTSYKTNKPPNQSAAGSEWTERSSPGSEWTDD